MTRPKPIIQDIKGKPYEAVASRLSRFRYDHSTARIDNTIHTVTETRVIIRCEVYSDSGELLASGHAEEIRDSSHINQTSALENAETSALGRALGIAGYDACNNVASADEVSSAVSQQSSRSSRPATSSLSRTPASPVDAPTPPGGSIVSSIEERQLTNKEDGQKFDKWTINLTDGTKLTTFKRNVGQAAGEGDHVEFDAGPPNKYGDRPLRWMKKIASAEHAETLPPADNFNEWE